VVAMYVDPPHWRRGVGGALMEAAIDRLERLPYDEAALWTFKENSRAIAFYERFGWREDGAEKIHARSEEPAIRMRRPVTIPATSGGRWPRDTCTTSRRCSRRSPPRPSC